MGLGGRTALRCAIAASLAVASLTSSGQTRELNFAIFAPPTGLVTKDVAEPWVAWAKSESGGELQIKIHAGGTLGRNPAQQLKLVQDGVADVAWIVPGYTPNRFPTLALFEMPGLVTDAKQGSAAALALYRQGKLPGFKDVKLVGIFATDTYNLHLNRPIATLAELKGKKLRSGGSIQNEIITALGGVPVGMPVTQIVESMARNVVDGTILNWTSLPSFKVDETALFHWNLKLGVTPLALVMNKATYEALSAKAKSVVDRSPEIVARLGGEAFEKLHATLVARFAKDDRHKIADPSATDQKEIDVRLGPIVEKAATGESTRAALADLKAALAAAARN